MFVSVYGYLKEIEDRNKDIAESQSKIDSITAKYNKELKPLESRIDRNHAEIASIKDITVHAELNDILKHIANELGCPTDQLKVTYSSDFDCWGDQQHVNHESMEFHLKKGKNVFKPIIFNFVIYRPMKKEETTAPFYTVKSTIPFDAIQKDQKPLHEHLFPRITTDRSLYPNLSIEFKDLSQIILPFKLHDLIQDNQTTVTPIPDSSAKIILQAAEDFRQKESEMAD